MPHLNATNDLDIHLLWIQPTDAITVGDNKPLGRYLLVQSQQCKQKYNETTSLQSLWYFYC